MDKVALEFLTKHGVAGLLAVWVLMLHLEVKDVRRDLKECMTARITHSHACNDTKDCEVDVIDFAAVLPEKLRIKTEQI